VAGFWPVSADVRERHRRSIYVFTRRSVPFPMLEAFDRASPQVAHARREVSTTPQQSLTLFNNDVVYEWSKSLAERASTEAARPTEAARIDRLFEILFARLPDKSERALARDFLNEQERIISSNKQQDAARPKPQPVALTEPVQSDARAQAFVDLAHTLANTNEFVYRY
jgi:hypothetical protein